MPRAPRGWARLPGRARTGPIMGLMRCEGDIMPPLAMSWKGVPRGCEGGAPRRQSRGCIMKSPSPPAAAARHRRHDLQLHAI